MIRDKCHGTTSRTALIAMFAAGLAAAPFTFGDSGVASITPNAVAAQEADVDADITADAEADAEGQIDAESGAAAAAAEENGEAEEFVTLPKDRVAGTGSVGISSGEQRYADPASVDTDVAGSPDDFQRYRMAAEQNDLPEAGMALSRAADRPVTEDYVTAVNEQLGVRTALTAEQIAEAAETAEEEGPLPY